MLLCEFDREGQCVFVEQKRIGLFFRAGSVLLLLLGCIWEVGSCDDGWIVLKKYRYTHPC